MREILPEAAEGADAVVLAGDLTHLGGYKEAEVLLAPLFSIGLPLLAVAGNMEYEGVRRYIGEKEIDIHGRGVELNGVGFMGLGGGTPSPFHSPWELTDEEARPLLAAGLAAIARRALQGARVSRAAARNKVGPHLRRHARGVRRGTGAH